MKEEEKNFGHGGRRTGAGRHKTESKLYAFRAQKDLSEFIDKQENKTEFIKQCIANTMQTKNEENTILNNLGDLIPADKVKPLTLPFFNIKIVAGFPIPLSNEELAQDIEILRMLCPHPESCYLIRVQGESMKDADIHTNDILIVDKSNRNPSRNEVAVCEINGEYTLKRFVKEGNKGWLIPANPDFPKIEIKPEDNFSIWGTVTYVIHKPRA